MPASTLEPVKSAIRNVLAKNNTDNYLNNQLSNSAHRVLCTKIDFEPAESYQSNVLNDLKSKYIVLQPSKPTNNGRKYEPNTNNEETLGVPTNVLYPIENVQLGWTNSDWGVGAGMMNMGNTCYLNSTLQALFHVPALVNWLLSDKQHLVQCENNADPESQRLFLEMKEYSTYGEQDDFDNDGGAQSCCIICAVSKTLQASQVKNANAIRPWLVYSKLRLVCRHLIPGRQEDAHEFLRYLVEAMEKSYIVRFRNLGNLDSRSKETTPLNQILGGYLRSAVRCLECGHVSTTFQHFQDLLLDIRKVNTLDEALDLYFSKEKLDDMAYHCDHCKKKVHATKQFTLERAPMVLCIQLKRFSVSNNKITKQLMFKPKMDLTRFSRQKAATPLLYQLVAIVTHMGPTVGCGHYTAVARAASGQYYIFDDSTVRQVSQQTVLNTNAYIMLYEAIKPTTLNNINKNNIRTEQKVTENESSFMSKSTVVSNGHFSPKIIENKKTETQNSNGISTNGISKKTYSSESDDSDKDSKKISQNSINDVYNSVSSPKRNGTDSEKLNKECKKQKKSTSSDSDDSENDAKKINDYHLNGTIQKSVKKDVGEHSNITKLVPYEVNDSSSSSSNEESDRCETISTKSMVGNWQVSHTNSKVISPSLQGHSSGWKTGRNESTAAATVEQLIRLSHEGYSAPVSTWNGTRAQLDRQIANERREERKRCMMDNNDRGKIKHARGNNGNSFQYNSSYNPFQEYSQRKWQNDSHRQFYNNNNRHRYNGNKRGNHHYNNRHRQKFRH